MIRQTELEMHERAKTLFEQENPGTLWRLSSGKEPPIGQGQEVDEVSRWNSLS